MIIQLAPPIPLYSVEHQEECYAFLALEYGIEDYVYFVVSMEKTGEIWVIPSSKLRASKNFTAGRPEINKGSYSAYLKHGSPNITPFTPDKQNDQDILLDKAT